MAKVTLTVNGKYLGEYPLVKARTSIGRRNHNDICLDNLAVSGEHASIVKMGLDYFVQDLNSTNGLLVNGVPSQKQLLQNHDVITIGGHYHLTYSSEAESVKSSDTVAAHGFEQTMMVEPSFIKSNSLRAVASAGANQSLSPDTNLAVSSGAKQSEAEKPQVFSDNISNQPVKDLSGMPGDLIARIQVLNGSNSGRELTLNKALTTLGKAGVQVAAITRRPGGYYITHVEGAVKPLVNGVAIGIKSHELDDHDVIELAGIKMEFYLVRNSGSLNS